MTDTKAQQLVDELGEFVAACPDVEAAAVVSFDGLAMASALPQGMDEDRLSAMSAALLSLGEQAARGLGRGELRQVFVEADEGFVFLMSAEDQAVLAAVTDARAKIGLMLFEMRRAARSIGSLLAGQGAVVEEAEAHAAAGVAGVLDRDHAPDVGPAPVHAPAVAPPWN